MNSGFEFIKGCLRRTNATSKFTICQVLPSHLNAYNYLLIQNQADDLVS